MIAATSIYRTTDGRLCGPDDPDVAYLVVAAGSEVPPDYAAKVSAYKPGKKRAAVDSSDEPDIDLAEITVTVTSEDGTTVEAEGEVVESDGDIDLGAPIETEHPVEIKQAEPAANKKSTPARNKKS